MDVGRHFVIKLVQLKSVAELAPRINSLSALILDKFAVIDAWWAERGCLKSLLICLGLKMSWSCMHH